MTQNKGKGTLQRVIVTQNCQSMSGLPGDELSQFRHRATSLAMLTGTLIGAPVLAKVTKKVAATAVIDIVQGERGLQGQLFRLVQTN